MDKTEREQLEAERRQRDHEKYMGGSAFHDVPSWKRWAIGLYIVLGGLTLLGMLGVILDRLSTWEMAALAFGITSVPVFIVVSRREAEFYRIRDRMRSGEYQ